MVDLPVAIGALISGALFGFLIKKGGISRFDTIVRQLLLKDFTLLKIILSAALTAAIALYLQDWISIRPQPLLSSMPVQMAALGGGVFGVGLAIIGYTPSTVVAAIGEGKKEAVFGFLGMVVGSILFSFIYPIFRKSQLAFDSTCQKTVHQFFGMAELISIMGLLLLLFGVYRYSKKKR